MRLRINQVETELTISESDNRHSVNDKVDALGVRYLLHEVKDYCPAAAMSVHASKGIYIAIQIIKIIMSIINKRCKGEANIL